MQDIFMAIWNSHFLVKLIIILMLLSVFTSFLTGFISVLIQTIIFGTVIWLILKIAKPTHG